MVLRYMVSDTDLVKVEFIKPEKEVLQPKRKDVQPTRKLKQPKRNKPSSKQSVKFRFFLMVIGILGIAKECFYISKRIIRQKLRAFCLLLAFSISFSGIAVLAYQSFVWLKHGYWEALGTRLILYKVLSTNIFQWLYNPRSWSSSNKIISPILNSSLAMFLLVFGLVVLLLVAKAFDLFSKPEKTGIRVVHPRNWRRT